MIGIDLLHLPRLAALLCRHNNRHLNRFARRILTATELSSFQRLPSDDGVGVVRWLGVRWAAKEAAFKAAGAKMGRLSWKEVEVGHFPSGQPYLTVRGGERAGLSISHDGDYVVAMAMLPLGS